MHSSSSLLQSINKFTTYILQLCACGMKERETRERERDQRERETREREKAHHWRRKQGLHCWKY